jgi:hypothetical protein
VWLPSYEVIEFRETALLIHAEQEEGDWETRLLAVPQTWVTVMWTLKASVEGIMSAFRENIMMCAAVSRTISLDPFAEGLRMRIAFGTWIDHKLQSENGALEMLFRT